MTPGGPSAAANAVEKLLVQLDKLDSALAEWKDKGAGVADLSERIANARHLAQTERLADAQAVYAEVAPAVDRALVSLKAEPLAWRLLLVESGYLLVILALGWLATQHPDYWIWKDRIGLSARAAWFGAVGGVTIGLYGIYNHISGKDFDPSFQLWYICKPVMGAIFGWFVFLVYYVGVLTSVPSQNQQKLDFTNPELGYLIAFLAGFSERFTIKTIDRFMTVLTVGEDKSKTKDHSRPEAPQNF